MSNNFDNLFQNLMQSLKDADKKHWLEYNNASDNNDWDKIDQELSSIHKIATWRKSLDLIYKDIIESKLIIDNNIVDIILKKNYKPTQIIFFKKIYTVTKWTDLYIKVCEILILYKPHDMAIIDKYDNLNFSYQKSDIKNNPIKLSNGIWATLHQDEDVIKDMCYKLLQRCDFSIDDLIIKTMEV